MDKVIFKSLEGEIIAFLPDNEVNYGMISSYMHIGQHSEASLGCYLDCKPAKPAEYGDLLAELVSLGYNPRIMKRLQYGDLNWQRGE